MVRILNGKTKSYFTNNQIKGFYLKADIKHYFQNIDHNLLLEILKRKIKDEQFIDLIKKIVANSRTQRERETY